MSCNNEAFVRMGKGRTAVEVPFPLLLLVEVLSVPLILELTMLGATCTIRTHP